MGYALGVIHISFEDFCKLTIGEFYETTKAFHTFQEAQSRVSWEQSRLMAYYSATGPNLDPKKLKGKTAQKLIPLPWDNQQSARRRKGQPAKGDRERFNALLAKYGRKYHGKEDREKLLERKGNGRKIDN